MLPEERGKGAGKALLRALARIELRKGCGRMEWVVLRENDPAIRFYKRIGAKLHEEWIVTRLSGAHLRNLAKGRYSRASDRVSRMWRHGIPSPALRYVKVSERR